MRLYLKSHIAKKGETLEQIAEQYQIPDIEILKYFHYQHVPKDSNHLGTTLFAGQEIFIPDENDIRNILEKRNLNIEENNIKNHNQIENGNLLPDFQSIHHTYIVEIRDVFENRTDHVQFEVLLQYLDKHDSHYIFKFKKENLLLNGENPELKVYNLALKCALVFSYVEVGINKNGLLSYVHNYKEIYNKWKILKENLYILYEDALSLRYIDEINTIIEDRDTLTSYLRKEIFLQFYFSVYFKIYAEGKSENVAHFLFDEILHENVYEININDKLITIKQESQSIDKRSMHEIFGNIKSKEGQYGESELPESTITAKYHLDKSQKILQKAEIKVESLDYHTKEFKEIQIRLKH
ncbi:LysM peptidoglycan-binding domain-containing protein [Chryseobacterium taichungense]|uniref:LysM peptidoglycan-binding domain-containing protein n=1 Tax=Chryseobacterium taichungense TaxID=295069 RepID=UPI0028B19479|nr:LysM peptidoglycan-binding domain-containing protein [Chryseobacterium taichungense]